MRIPLLVGGVVLNGVATGLYIAARFGPGPRDGLMTGLHRRTGRSIRLVRTGIEVTVLATGFSLGGTVGVGTVLYALAIGPLAQFFLRVFAVPGRNTPAARSFARRATTARSDTADRDPQPRYATPISTIPRRSPSPTAAERRTAWRTPPPPSARAVEAGYRYLETDVHATADGRLVAFHDATLDRVTDAGGPDRRPAVAGGAARAGWRAGSRCRCSRSCWRRSPRPAGTSTSRRSRPWSRCWSCSRRTDAWDRVCVGSFSEARVARAQRLAGPRLATSHGTRGVLGLRLRSYGLPGRAARRCAVARAGPRAPVRASGWWTARFVRAAHARGLQVHVWTVNEPDRMAALLDLGVDGIMTDHIETLRTVLSERGAWA